MEAGEAVCKLSASPGVKRGQSSVEYLMTYGWAFIILLAVIAILYSIGVFNPQQYMGEECLFQPSLQCRAMTLDSKTGKFSLTLNNGLGYKIVDVKSEIEVLSFPEGKRKFGGGAQGAVLPNGNIIVEAVGLPTATLRTASLEKVKVTITYRLEGGGTDYKTSGVVAVRVS